MSPNALTIAGSDPSGGAGIQADIKAFSALGVYGTAVITALTIQDSMRVHEVIPVPSDLLERELKVLFEDISFDAVKTGIIYNIENLKVIKEIFSKYKIKKYILDPIISSSNGFQLISRDSIYRLKELFPHAFLITPNIPEAELLSGIRIRSERDMMESAEILYSFGSKYVLIKGGHFKGDAIDILYNGREYEMIISERISDKDIHGTGCVFSSAITSELAKGYKVEDAVKRAKKFINYAIKNSVKIGNGREVIYIPSSVL
ncbi:MAG: bifunctional hydroxymethylpyrimidine kinase/phosphomethylpyrimidine kinase [Nitrospirota bacterium]